MKSNLFVKKFPEGLKDFTEELNPKIDIYNLTYSSSQKINWQCFVCSHNWTVSLNSRTQFSILRKCPKCSRKIGDKKRIETNSIKTGSISKIKPEILQEWDFKKNAGYDPDKISHKSSRNFWWVCKNCDYEFKAKPYVRIIDGTGCKICSFNEMGKRYQLQASKKNWFGKTNPELINLWDYDKNKDLDIKEFSKSSNITVYWKCKFGHSFSNSFNKMTARGSQCPKCSLKGSSRNELRIYIELKKLIQEIKWRSKINNIELDIFLKNFNLGIEYDGLFWHKDKYKVDLNKNNHFEKLGIKILRVREKGLKKIRDTDIIVPLTNLEFKDIKKILFIIYKITNSKNIHKIYLRYKNNKKFIAEKEFQKVISRLPAPPPGSSFADVCPKKMIFWDYEKNYPLTPDLFYPRATFNAHWKCNDCNSSFKKNLDRVFSNKYVCLKCSRKKAAIFKKKNKTTILEERENLINFIEKNNIEYVKKLSPMSHKKVKLVCPSCNKKTTSSCKQIYKNKYLCLNCGLI